MHGFWNDDWLKAWGAFTPSPQGNPFAAALDQWWQTFPRDSDEQAPEVLDKLIRQARAFFELGEQINRSAADVTTAGGDWQALIDQSLGVLKNSFGSAAPGAASPDMGFWQMPLETWQRAASALSGLPGDYLGASAAGWHGTADADLRGKLDQILSSPGIGYTRERQEQAQKFAKLLMEYQRVYQRYVSVYVEMGRRSVERLQRKVAERAKEGGEPVSSVRELYDLWIQCSEEVYAETTLRDEYVDLHGELVNASLALKRHTSVTMDEIAGTLNLPTRREMETMQRRYQHSRRQENQLRRQVADLGTELDRIKSENEQLRAAHQRLAESLERTQERLEQTRLSLEQRLHEIAAERIVASARKKPRKRAAGKPAETPS